MFSFIGMLIPSSPVPMSAQKAFISLVGGSVEQAWLQNKDDFPESTTISIVGMAMLTLCVAYHCLIKQMMADGGRLEADGIFRYDMIEAHNNTAEPVTDDVDIPESIRTLDLTMLRDDEDAFLDDVENEYNRQITTRDSSTSDDVIIDIRDELETDSSGEWVCVEKESE